jgi:hypothetical protein
MNEPKKNLNAIFLGIGEFSFAKGATSRATARTRGYRDVGNIQAFTPETENTKEEHEGSYRTGRRVDKIFSTKQKIEYVIRSDEFNAGQLQMLLMGADPSGDNAAGALTASQGDSFDFSTTNSESDLWYEIFLDDVRRGTLTSVILAGPANAVTPEADDDTFTDNAHGLSDGDAIVFQATAIPTGLTAGTVYYVRDSAANTFKVAATIDGAAIDITTDGTGVEWYPVMTEGTDYEVDLRSGRVRFLTTQSGTVIPFLTAAAITSSSAAYARSIEPLQDPIFEGYGRLLVFDPDKTDRIMIDHRDFSCTVIAERAGELDGKKPVEVTLRVTVTDDVGECFFAASLSQTA